MADNNIQATKGSGSNAVVADTAAAKSPKNDKSADSLLDIFTTEEIKESSISKLCKDLNDVSIDSLLEQTRQVANQIRAGYV